METTLTQLLDLSGRTAIVTGGAMGIGRAIGERLHEAGANVVVADLDEGAAQETAAALERRREGSAVAVATDVADGADVERMVAEAVDRFGGVDVLVNNAGIFPFTPLTELEEEAFARVLAVNVRGVYLCTRAVARRMIEQGRGGSIVNVSSIAAVHPASPGLSAYVASKHAVWGFTKSCALELAEHGIRVNALAPGGVLTPGVMALQGPAPEPAAADAPAQDPTAGIPMKRMADADEMGRVALFLVSDLATYMTGSQVVADGGLLLG